MHGREAGFMNTWAKPRIFVSRCLGLEACRYNGELIRSQVVDELLPWVETVSCCPEKEIGLGIPRDPVRVLLGPEGPSLVQPASGRDLTARMNRFANDYLSGVGTLDGLLLKGRSPSCGLVDVKHYTSTKPGAVGRRGAGLFGAAAAGLHPAAGREDEGRLRNFAIREHFFTTIFTLAAFRQAAAAGRMGGLVAFHAKYKLLLMAYNQTRMRILGRITANPDKLPPARVIAAYGQELGLALKRKPTPGNQVNVLLHAFGYFSKQLGPKEKAHFLDSLEVFRQKRLPLSALLAVVSSWIARFENDYLAGQAYFQPYPRQLNSLSDSGKGRDY
jgi:uncharacterized protein YbgA (DUF1722 family)/uncharacterized protein YbbK (DUF523 family)